jgi:hypothetical protein
MQLPVELVGFEERSLQTSLNQAMAVTNLKELLLPDRNDYNDESVYYGD